MGNHELDNGAAGLVRPFLQNATFPVLACNVNASLEPDLEALINPYVIKVVGGRKIALVGYVTAETKYLVDPGK